MQGWCGAAREHNQSGGQDLLMGYTSRLSVSEHLWQLKLCSWHGTGAGLGALMMNLAWDGRDWLLCGCGYSHQCHPCCHWQGAQLVLFHMQFFIDPHSPCRKRAVVVQWQKRGSRHSSGAASGHSQCQSVLRPSSASSSPTKTGLGQWTVVRTSPSPGGQHSQE